MCIRDRVQLTPSIDVDAILKAVKEKYVQYDVTDIDGVKIDFPDKWVHLRKSKMCIRDSYCPLE